MSERKMTIDLTPTWGAAVRIYMAVLEDGTEEGKIAAREDLTAMADRMDRFNKVDWETVLDAAERRAYQWRYAVNNESPENCIPELWDAGQCERVEWAEKTEAAVADAWKLFEKKT